MPRSCRSSPVAVADNVGDARRCSRPATTALLGFTKLGAEARRVIAVVQTAMVAAMRYTGLRDSTIALPTMAEGLGVFFSNAGPTGRARGIGTAATFNGTPPTGSTGYAARAPRLVRFGSCVTSMAGPNGHAQLYER